MSGKDAEQSVDAEVGAILEAQTAIDIGRLVEIAEWLQESWSK